MLRRHIILLIAIRPSDGDDKRGGHLGIFREEQAISRHGFHLLPFYHHHHHLILVPHVMWFSQEVRESKIDHTQRDLSVLLRNPKRLIVQLGWHWNPHELWTICNIFSFQHCDNSADSLETCSHRCFSPGTLRLKLTYYSLIKHSVLTSSQRCPFWMLLIHIINHTHQFLWTTIELENYQH